MLNLVYIRFMEIVYGNKKDRYYYTETNNTCN